MIRTRGFEAGTGWPPSAAGGGGARTVEEWLQAVAAVRPSSRLRDKMALQSAIYTIAATCNPREPIPRRHV